MTAVHRAAVPSAEPTAAAVDIVRARRAERRIMYQMWLPVLSLDDSHCGLPGRDRSKGAQMTAVTETPTIPAAGAAPVTPEPATEMAEQWAKDYLTRLTEETTKRLAQIAAGPNGSGGGIRPRIGEPTVGQYVAFDVAATSPLQATGLPPYQPGKVIAAGEPAFLVAIMFVNPMASIQNGFAVPPTVQLGGRRWRLSLDLANLTDLTHTTLVQTGTYGAQAPALDFAVFTLPTPDPGPDAAVYEANVTLDIVDAGQPYAAFATNFLDVDGDPGFVFVPPAPPGWRHDLPNRYLVYSK
jgi:hypothetical protein